jgi:hypothetical protein
MYSKDRKDAVGADVGEVQPGLPDRVELADQKRVRRRRPRMEDNCGRST